MTRWHVTPGDIVERTQDFTATFSCTNGETGAVLEVAITQKRGGKAIDLVGALLSTGELLRQAASDQLEPTKFN